VASISPATAMAAASGAMTNGEAVVDTGIGDRVMSAPVIMMRASVTPIYQQIIEEYCQILGRM
jgi:hypothetical protein